MSVREKAEAPIRSMVTTPSVSCLLCLHAEKLDALFPMRVRGLHWALRTSFYCLLMPACEENWQPDW